MVFKAAFPRGAFAALVGWFAFACSSGISPDSVPEQLVCPELAGEADPLQLAFTDNDAANGRIRAFVSSTRGLYDAAVEMERMAVDACRRMSLDVGFSATAQPSSVQEACTPVIAAISRLRVAGIAIRVAIAEPHCGVDAAREAACSSNCSQAGAECRGLCRAQAAIYGQCSLPSVSVSISSNLSEAVALGLTLERNLPGLLYAELALGRRLADHGETIIRVAAKLPKDLKSANPRALACVTLAATVAGTSATRLQGVISASSALTSSWPSAVASREELP